MNLKEFKQIKLKGGDRKMTKIKQEKGITLIALVVTIVVLLILAGVSVNAIFNDNGIIKKAQEAQNKMDEAQKSDLDAINSLNEWIDSKVNETPTTPVTSSEMWTFNDVISSQGVEFNVNFTSNNQQFSKIKVILNGAHLKYDEKCVGTGEPISATNVRIPVETAYKKITFETAPTGDLLTWLQSNATKQE